MWELVQRDKNRPNVIMWSLANEPASDVSSAGDYFKTVAEWTRSLDPTRPISFVTDKSPGEDQAVSMFDSILKPKDIHTLAHYCCVLKSRRLCVV